MLILDEPTAALPSHEATALLETLARLTATGLAVVLITHRLDEVVGVADRVSVLRDGQLIASVDGRGLTEEQLIEYIVGRPLGAVFPEMPEPSGGQAALTVENLTAGPLRDISLTVRRGEVVGIAGLLGTGRTTLLRAIYGDLTPSSGRVLAGRPGTVRATARPRPSQPGSATSQKTGNGKPSSVTCPCKPTCCWPPRQSSGAPTAWPRGRRSPRRRPW